MPSPHACQAPVRPYPRDVRIPLLLLVVVSLAAGCGGDRSPASTTADTADTTSSTTPTTPTTSDGGCADVVDVEIEPGDDGTTFTFSATVASADTGWDKYADAWEVRAPDGDVLGVRELLHPHVDEQPFTRSLAGVDIPGDVDRVTVAARDSVEGFCGEVFEVPVP